MIICIIGLSGSGKTTLAREIYRLWKEKVPQTVHIDGDEIRRILKQDTGGQDYSVQRRMENMERILELSLWLDRQQINVVSSIISPFEKIRARYISESSKYYEVFVDVPLKDLIARDTRKVYTSEKNVVGIDIPFDLPNPSRKIINTGNLQDFLNNAPEILIDSGAPGFESA